MAGNIPLVLSKNNKSWHQSGRGTATSTDDQEDIFQQRPRQETSTSRSLSSPMMTPNGFLDSCANNIEHFSGGPSNNNKNGQYPIAMAESSGRDSDEDDDDEEEEEEEEVEMVDHACQTRESLFDNNPSDLLSAEQARQSLRGQPMRVPLPSDSRYKAERTIEIAQRSPQPLPSSSSSAANRMKFSKASTTNSSSAASSKSGADVVVLH